MTRTTRICALAVLALLILGACGRTAPIWYEWTCMKKGYQEGSPAYNACVERERKWIAEQQKPPAAE